MLPNLLNTKNKVPVPVLCLHCYQESISDILTQHHKNTTHYSEMVCPNVLRVHHCCLMKNDKCYRRYSGLFIQPHLDLELLRGFCMI